MKKSLKTCTTSVRCVCANVQTWMNRVWRTALALFVCSLIAAPLIGCASSQTAYPYHGLDISNWGSARVEQIEVRYGELVRKHPALLPTSGHGYYQNMPIPEFMSVKWKSSAGTSHSVEVPVRSKLSRQGTFRRVEVILKDDLLEVNEIWMPAPLLDPQQNKFKIYP